MKNDENDYSKINDILAKYGIEPMGSIGKEEPTPLEPTKEEKTDPGITNEPTENHVITLVEDDMESGEMYNRQKQYEDELMQYPPDDPRNLFPRNYLRENYIPTVPTKAKPTPKADENEVAEEILNDAYTRNNKGDLVLDEVKFCKIWKKRFNYTRMGSLMLTPVGSITREEFKSKIARMILRIGMEKKKVDRLVENICSTYEEFYPAETEDETMNRTIPFRNGDLVLNPDGKTYTFKEGSFSPVQYRFDYDFKNIPNCDEPPFPNFRKWKDGLFTLEDQYTLKQMLGYLLIPSNKAQEAFFIVGKGGSGKSILTDCIIPKMLGRAAFPISIGNFFNNQFQLWLSEGKLCMYDDDIGETNLTRGDSGRFKNFITAKTIQVERKHCDATIARKTARIVCSGNHMINSDDKTDGFTRRLHPIYTKPREIEKVDRRFPEKIEAEIEMIVLWALEGLIELTANDGVPYWSERTRENFAHYTEGQKWEEQFIVDCFCFKENTVTYSQDIQAALEGWVKDNYEICGDGPMVLKYKAVSKWLQDEGENKYGYIYKRGIRRGDTYNARGYVNMALKEPVTDPDVFLNEVGSYVIRTRKKKPEDQVETDNDI